MSSKLNKTLENFLMCWSLAEIRSGLNLTLMQLYSDSITLKFPYQQTPRSRRYRGALALTSYADGKERCIACKLCEAVCPALAITIELEEDQNTGARQANRFDIDAFKCVHCGLCEEACPVDAIVLTDQIHYHFEKNNERIMDKQTLLAIGEFAKDKLAKDKAAEKDYR